MIDLRSDTVTRPTPDMLMAVGRARVGDDVYGEDPSVIELEERTADTLGFEAGLFCPTGSLSNVLAVAALVRPGQEVLCEGRAHIVRAELGAHGAVTGVTTRTWNHARGHAPVDDVLAMVAPDLGPFLVQTAAVSVENTHNFAGGTVQPHDELVRLREALGDVPVHCDGARVWNAHVATGMPLRDLGARVADTMSVCFSKGLGAPVGSVMLGTTEQVAEARARRKRLGGGWRQAGYLAAAATYALDHHVERLATDHEHARVLAAAVGVDPREVETNIVVVETDRAAQVVQRCADDGVLVSAVGPTTVRLVTHLDVDAGQTKQAAEVVARALAAD